MSVKQTSWLLLSSSGSSHLTVKRRKPTELLVTSCSCDALTFVSAASPPSRVRRAALTAPERAGTSLGVNASCRKPVDPNLW